MTPAPIPARRHALARPEHPADASRRRERARALAVAAALAVLAAPSAPARADERCGVDLQQDVCLEADPVCPPVAEPVGPSAGSWPVFQHDLQHTGRTDVEGPTCADVLWTTKLKGKLLSAPVLVPPAAGDDEVLFVPVGKAPVCSLDPDDGSVLGCATDALGKFVDRSTPAVGNGNLLYVGTRDNDLWAIEMASASGVVGTVAWRQKVCTDGDVTTPPLIGPDGTVYMGSDSLGAGTLMAMCPGSSRQPRWCINPVGGGIRNSSPALSPEGDRLYVTIGNYGLAAFDPATGAEVWRVGLERPSGVGRTPNHTPVVHPVTGTVYVGTRSGLWALQRTTDAESGQESGVAQLLFDTRAVRQALFTPPAVDATTSTIVFGASRGAKSTLYAIGLDGSLKWKRSDLGRGRFRNNPPVIDGAGRVYVALNKSVIALSPAGATLWRVDGKSSHESSPILATGRLYVGASNGLVTAIGGCAP